MSIIILYDTEYVIFFLGFTMGIPDTVMGLTLIAVGVSVPDALSSLCVVKQGTNKQNNHTHTETHTFNT